MGNADSWNVDPPAGDGTVVGPVHVDSGLAIEVAWSPAPRDVRLARVCLAPGATVADAVRACGWPEVQSVIDDPVSGLATAVWGQGCEASRALREGDRVEILRVLEVDPMEARRERYDAAGGASALRRKRQALQPRKVRGTKPTSRSSAR
jgi:putative ubiquitin-RnfH superfamily antitoxin RatB of RatAB toxin-antitoxin module